ncbi:hypothetical protein PYCCODRAFT_110950 [Trametes coccinea BRFM310]|uniref:Uncharacterized protein n=1 Tax=Trametes coccinea (strain BRFM310) TaxID=1353009 RepID=A0A1Y2ITW6_TRAC3|nr:hypothetical protein PYCCODRAFT_110950 [Trametes coccinea BRFM310]
MFGESGHGWRPSYKTGLEKEWACREWPAQFWRHHDHPLQRMIQHSAPRSRPASRRPILVRTFTILFRTFTMHREPGCTTFGILNLVHTSKRSVSRRLPGCNHSERCGCTSAPVFFPYFLGFVSSEIDPPKRQGVEKNRQGPCGRLREACMYRPRYCIRSQVSTVLYSTAKSGPSSPASADILSCSRLTYTSPREDYLLRTYLLILSWLNRCRCITENLWRRVRQYTDKTIIHVCRVPLRLQITTAHPATKPTPSSGFWGRNLNKGEGSCHIGCLISSQRSPESTNEQNTQNSLGQTHRAALV